MACRNEPWYGMVWYGMVDSTMLEGNFQDVVCVVAELFQPFLCEVYIARAYLNAVVDASIPLCANW